MKDLAYHFHITQPENLIFELPSYAHFGDKIAFLNLLRSLNPPEYRVNPGASGESVETVRLFFDDHRLTHEAVTCIFRGTPEYLDEVYKNKYHLIKSQHNNHPTNRKLITYSFEARYAREAKIPPYISELLSEFKKLADVVEEGESLGVLKTTALIQESQLFVGVDNGVSHLCRCTNTPHLILEHLFDVSRGFPRDFYDYWKANSLQSAVDIARSILVDR